MSKEQQAKKYSKIFGWSLVRLLRYVKDDTNTTINDLNQLLLNYSINHVNISSLVEKILAASPSTGPIEWSFSEL